MKAVRAGVWLQSRIFRTSLGELSIVLAIPFYVLMFFSITRASGRTDLDVVSLVAPCLAGAWTLGLGFAGGIVNGDRWQGMTEIVMATLTSLVRLNLGRCAAVGAGALACFAEAWACAALFFGVHLNNVRYGYAALTIVLTCLAVVGTTSLFTGLFRLSRTTTSAQNYLGYPIYVIGGIFTPASFLPHWLQPLSQAVYLTWASDALRWSLGSGGPRPTEAFIAIPALAVAALVVGLLIDGRVGARLRQTGEASLT